MQYITDQLFTKIRADALPAACHFEACRFTGCNFSYANLSAFIFADCEFTDCNLMLATVAGTGLQNIKFTGCKLSGIHFSKSSDFLFELHFTRCLLDNAVFYHKKNKKARFTDCSLQETDFTEADLTDAIFDQCNLQGARFERSRLQGADFRTSYNFSIDPELNQLKKARFSMQGLPGLLGKYGIVITP